MTGIFNEISDSFHKIFKISKSVEEPTLSEFKKKSYNLHVKARQRFEDKIVFLSIGILFLKSWLSEVNWSYKGTIIILREKVYDLDGLSPKAAGLNKSSASLPKRGYNGSNNNRFEKSTSGNVITVNGTVVNAPRISNLYGKRNIWYNV